MLNSASQNLIITLFTFVILISIFSCEKNYHFSDNSEGERTNHNNELIKKWTILFYDDADFYGYDPFNDFRKEIIPNDKVNTIILRDEYHADATLYEIKNDTFIVKREPGEINMGSEQTLKDFLNYAKENYPAERYILAFYDHGMGWEGACIDNSHNDDYLTMNEIQTGLSDFGGVDLVLFTAPCIMGAIESAYELREFTDIYIGSEDYSGYCFWFNVIEEITLDLKENPNISNIDLANNIIDYVYLKSFQWDDWQKDLTMSAIEVSKLEKLVNYLDSISYLYYENIESFSDLILHDDFQVHKFHENIDIFEFLLQIEKIETNENILNYSASAREFFLDAVINECHGDNHPYAHGLTIYFPGRYSYNSKYSDENELLDFTLNTNWDELLELYYDKELFNPRYLQIVNSDCFSYPELKK